MIKSNALIQTISYIFFFKQHPNKTINWKNISSNLKIIVFYKITPVKHWDLKTKRSAVKKVPTSATWKLKHGLTSYIYWVKTVEKLRRAWLGVINRKVSFQRCSLRGIVMLVENSSRNWFIKTDLKNYKSAFIKSKRN